LTITGTRLGGHGESLNELVLFSSTRPRWLKKVSPLSDYSDTIAALYDAFSMNIEADTQFDKYEIRSEIGERGMGEVYLDSLSAKT